MRSNIFVDSAAFVPKIPTMRALLSQRILRAVSASLGEHGNLDTPVDYICEASHAQARYLGWLRGSERAGMSPTGRKGCGKQPGIFVEDDEDPERRANGKEVMGEARTDRSGTEHKAWGSIVRWLFPGVLAQREMEKRRCPLAVRFRPFGAGIFKAWGSIVMAFSSHAERRGSTPALLSIGSMSPTRLSSHAERERINSRAAEHRLDEPHQVIPQHGCLPRRGLARFRLHHATLVNEAHVALFKQSPPPCRSNGVWRHPGNLRAHTPSPAPSINSGAG